MGKGGNTMKRFASLLLCLLLTACQAKAAELPAKPVEELPVVIEQNISEEIPVEKAPEKEKPTHLGTGQFLDGGELDMEQKQLILRYMRNWYQSLGLLERQDISQLFAPDAEDALRGNEAVWNYIIGLRKLPEQDMSLTSFDFRLTVKRCQEKDGMLVVLLSEDSVQNFASLPGIDTESYDVHHLFLLEKQENDRWLLQNHFQLDSLYQTVLGRDYFRSEENMKALRSFFSDGAGAQSQNDDEEELRHETYEEQIQSLLIEAQIEIGSRRREEADPMETQQSYDREAAVAYAEEWVGQRNEEWPDYSPYGGNCQNFVSQCIHAGGIPMDIYSPGVWKWYGSTPNGYASMNGRSPSWSAVKDFLDYVESNGSRGLVAQADAPYYSGEQGDVIHLAADDGNWKHTVLITEVLKNEQGETYDYLIHSNTADLKNFPVSIYPYPRQLLIKIHGWNK